MSHLNYKISYFHFLIPPFNRFPFSLLTAIYMLYFFLSCLSIVTFWFKFTSVPHTFCAFMSRVSVRFSYLSFIFHLVSLVRHQFPINIFPLVRFLSVFVVSVLYILLLRLFLLLLFRYMQWLVYVWPYFCFWDSYYVF